jgi:hypothetical protein
MGYGYARARGGQIEQLGFSGSGSTTTVTSGATAGTFGTLTTIGATGFVYDGLTLSIGSSAQRRGICTVTANTGGADVVIADSIPFNAMAGANLLTSYIDLPIRVPSGAVIKAKVATETAGSSATRVAITGYRSSALAQGFSRVVSCTDLSGSDPTNAITLNGTTLTGWVTVNASTPADIGWLWAVPLCFNTSMGLGTTGQVYIEVGWGSSGNEQALFRVPLVANADFGGSGIGIPCMIPAGTRLAARAQASGAATATIGVVCYGAQP